MLEFLFSPLLVLEPVLAVTIFAVVILILINLCYRFLVNQQESKQIKEKVKELNKQMKEEQKKGNKDRVNELMKETMIGQNKLMRMTMKPMLVSFVLVILFLPSLSSNYADHIAAIEQNTGNITIDNELYLIHLENDKVNVTKGGLTVFSFTSAITEKIGNNEYLISHEKQGCMLFFCNQERIKFSRIIAKTPVPVPVFPSMSSIITVNKKEFGWLGWYFLISIPFAILIRKMLKIST